MKTQRTVMMRRQVFERIVCAGVPICAMAVLVTGCYLSHPKYTVYPTLQLRDRIEDSDEDVGDKSEADGWRTSFQDSIELMEESEWNPSSFRLANACFDVGERYGVPSNRWSSLMAAACCVFTDMFKLDGQDMSSKGARRSITAMVKRIDQEHPHLLVPSRQLRNPMPVDQARLPAVVSGIDPVAVSLTRWTTSTQKQSASVVTSTVAIVVNSQTNAVVKGNNSTFIVSVGDTSAKEKKDEKSVTTVEDFSPEQSLTLSLSTVLNSPSVFDRIEYVSTYVWIEPYPFPPNSDVVPERDFWQRFYALNAYRNESVQKAAEINDLRRALDDMRVRLVDVETDVKTTAINLGTWTRTGKKTTSAELAGSVGLSSGASLSPSVSYENSTEAKTEQTLQKELDRRSTYIDASGHFLRITQRGMESANLAGRFLEKITLRIPAAGQACPVLVPDSTSTYAVKWLSMPLYSRVEAWTFSVVVARQTTKLAKDEKNTYHVTDSSDAALVVGVTRPSRIVLWQFERQLEPVFEKDVTDSRNGGDRLIRFAAAGTNQYAYPLFLSGFDRVDKAELLDQLRTVNRTNDLMNVGFVLKHQQKAEGGSSNLFETCYCASNSVSMKGASWLVNAIRDWLSLP